MKALKDTFTHHYTVTLTEKNKNPKNPETPKEYHKKILNILETIPESERIENILLVNGMQEDILKEKYGIIFPDSNHITSRKLVAYYRPTQISLAAQKEIKIIMEFLRFYVEGWYSQLFNEFAVVYRFPETDNLPDFERNSYKVTGEEFQKVTTIFADTIHFSDGTPEDIEWTLPILGTTPHKRPSNKKFKENPHFEREYEIIEKTAGRWGIKNIEKNQKDINSILLPKNIIPILESILKVVQKTESTLIQQAKKYFEK